MVTAEDLSLLLMAAVFGFVLMATLCAYLLSSRKRSGAIRRISQLRGASATPGGSGGGLSIVLVFASPGMESDFLYTVQQTQRHKHRMALVVGYLATVLYDVVVLGPSGAYVNHTVRYGIALPVFITAMGLTFSKSLGLNELTADWGTTACSLAIGATLLASHQIDRSATVAVAPPYGRLPQDPVALHLVLYLSAVMLTTGVVWVKRAVVCTLLWVYLVADLCVYNSAAVANIGCLTCQVILLLGVGYYHEKADRIRFESEWTAALHTDGGIMKVTPMFDRESLQVRPTGSDDFQNQLQERQARVEKESRRQKARESERCPEEAYNAKSQRRRSAGQEGKRRMSSIPGEAVGIRRQSSAVIQITQTGGAEMLQAAAAAEAAAKELEDVGEDAPAESRSPSPIGKHLAESRKESLLFLHLLTPLERCLNMLQELKHQSGDESVIASIERVQEILQTTNSEELNTVNVEQQQDIVKGVDKQTSQWIESQLVRATREDHLHSFAPSVSGSNAAGSPQRGFSLQHALSANDLAMLRSGRDSLVHKIGHPTGASPQAKFVSEGISKLMTQVCKWDFDMFELNKESNCFPLYYLFISVLDKFALTQAFNLPLPVIKRVAEIVEHQYCFNPKMPNAYHNNMHGADVLQTAACFLIQPEISPFMDDPVDIMSLVIATMMHDYRHKGVSNKFLADTMDELAVAHNDSSILERFHCAEAFKLFAQEETKLFQNMTPPDHRRLRHSVINMILATDLTTGFTHIANFNKLCDHISAEKTRDEFVLLTDEDQLSLMRFIVKASDVSNPAKPLQIAVVWTVLICEEFFYQGELEKQHGLPVGPTNDRMKVDVPALQRGFIDFVVTPTLKPLADFCSTNGDVWIKQLKSNYAHWQSLSTKGLVSLEDVSANTAEYERERAHAKRRSQMNADASRRASHHSVVTSPSGGSKGDLGSVPFDPSGRFAKGRLGSSTANSIPLPMIELKEVKEESSKETDL
jgi:hypothetical protein